MRPRELFRKILSSPRRVATVLSLALHLLVILFASDHQGEQRRIREKEKKREIARIKLQVVPLAPDAPAPAMVQVFREDLFKDTRDEEKNLFKLRKTEDARRRIDVDQDRNMRDLLKNPGGSPLTAMGTNAAYPFYLLDREPGPRSDYLSGIPFPDRARALGIRRFSLVVEMIIDRKGQVISPRLVTSGDYGFGDAVLRALTGVRFYPGKTKGKAVRALIRERFLFTDGGR